MGRDRIESGRPVSTGDWLPMYLPCHGSGQAWERPKATRAGPCISQATRQRAACGDGRNTGTYPFNST